MAGKNEKMLPGQAAVTNAPAIELDPLAELSAPSTSIGRALNNLASYDALGQGAALVVDSGIRSGNALVQSSTLSNDETFSDEGLREIRSIQRLHLEGITQAAETFGLELYRQKGLVTPTLARMEPSLAENDITHDASVELVRSLAGSRIQELRESRGLANHMQLAA